MKQTITLFLAAMIAASVLSAPPAVPGRERSAQMIIEELAVCYGAYGEQAADRLDALLTELRSVDPAAGDKWARILTLWRSGSRVYPVHYAVLPNGLKDTDELAIVVLGYKLNDDGTMADELIDRLMVVKRSAKKYPNAYIVCTGGGTAAQDESATEAGKMAEWLIENGIDRRRVIVEDASLTTAQNVINTCDILSEQYPRVTDLAIVSSDYHISTGALLFGAETILRSGTPQEERYTVVSNAACRASYGTLSPMFQAGALIELSGDTQTAYEIYFDTYDLSSLLPLE